MNVIKKNKFLFLSLLIFMVLSFISIFSASMYLSPTLGKLYYKQIFWYFIGFIVIILFNKISINTIYKYTFHIYIVNIILLFGLFFMGAINGSKSWYVIPGIGSFQPSEFMKVSLILFNSTIIYKFYKKEKEIYFRKELLLLVIILVVFFIPAILTFLQPDTGAVIIYFIISFSMLFASGINKKWVIYISFILFFLFSIFFILYFFYEDLFIQIFGNSFFYRLERIINWKNGSGMQLNNSMAAIGSSGIIGHGFNNTPIYFPEAGTDFIFTVYSSNFGLLGSVILIIFFIIFDLYLIKISKEVYSIQDKYTLMGIISMLVYQQIQNMGMTIGILPITGITLPFISYGGSSLLSYFLLIGIVINIISTDKKKKAYK